MPTYNAECTGCQETFEMKCSMSELPELLDSCVCCGESLKQVILEAPQVSIAYKDQASPNMNRKEQARVPINIIDEKADGSVKVTRIGRKSDIDGG